MLVSSHSILIRAKCSSFVDISISKLSLGSHDFRICCLLISDYSGDPQKALGLWMQMQEEDVQPSDQFLCLLADILKRHDMEVPFTVPNVKLRDSSYFYFQSRSVLSYSISRIFSYFAANSRFSQDKIRVSRNSQIFRKYLNDGQVDEAIELKHKFVLFNSFEITHDLKFMVTVLISPSPFSVIVKN